MLHMMLPSDSSSDVYYRKSHLLSYSVTTSGERVLPVKTGNIPTYAPELPLQEAKNRMYISYLHEQILDVN
jgi:hypothetical protein